MELRIDVGIPTSTTVSTQFQRNQIKSDFLKLIVLKLSYLSLQCVLVQRWNKPKLANGRKQIR